MIKAAAKTRNDNVGQQTNGVPPIVRSVLQREGQPLQPAVRLFMEERFGHDFSKVRVHTDSQAAASAQAVSASAYTTGRHIVFRAGRYAPDTTEGKRRLAHELTHVVQQSRGSSSSASTQGAESEADRCGRQASATAGPVTSVHTAAPGIQREEEKEKEVDWGTAAWSFSKETGGTVGKNYLTLILPPYTLYRGYELMKNVAEIAPRISQQYDDGALGAVMAANEMFNPIVQVLLAADRVAKAVERGDSEAVGKESFNFLMAVASLAALASGAIKGATGAAAGTPTPKPPSLTPFRFTAPGSGLAATLAARARNIALTIVMRVTAALESTIPPRSGTPGLDPSAAGRPTPALIAPAAPAPALPPPARPAPITRAPVTPAPITPTPVTPGPVTPSPAARPAAVPVVGETQTAPRPPVRAPAPIAAGRLTPSGGVYRERVSPPIPLGRGFNQVLGNAIADEATARAVLRRLANGNATALQVLGVTAPPGYIPSRREWGLGRRARDFVIIQGGTGGVDWEQVIAQGIEPLAHSHPNLASRVLSRPGVTITELLSGGFSIDAMHVLPSVADFRFSAKHGPHVVETPYSSVGGLAIGDAGVGDPITFRISDASTPGFIRGEGMVHTALLEMVVNGRVVWSGRVWAWGDPPVVQTAPPSRPIIPFTRPGAP